MKLHYLTARQLAGRIRAREISAEEAAGITIERIREIDPVIGAYITVVEKEALAKAREVDGNLAQGEGFSGLAGVPMALKDNICTKDVRTTCCSRILQNFIPPYSATVYKRLEDGGAVLVGKTNMDEFAVGYSTESSAFKGTRNPWDTDRVPGGSSGGSAAAVASGTAFYALGSDTGGSVRQPAALCGVVGMKPTYGRVSRYGVVAFASSLEQAGCITRDVADCASVMNHICGYDQYDSTSARLEVPDFTANLAGGIKGLRVAVPREYFEGEIDAEVRETVMRAVRSLEGLGAVCGEVSLPHTRYALPAYYIIASAEASSNLARYDGIRYGDRAKGFADLEELYVRTRTEGFGAEVKGCIMLGIYVLNSNCYDVYYKRARKVRRLVKDDFDGVFKGYDVVACPTSPTVAFKAGERARDSLKMYLSGVYTVPANMAGLPAISVPCGFAGGLPVGLQLVGKPFDEATLLRAAYAYEQNTGHHNERPGI